MGNNAENFGGRYDIDAMMVWEMRNLGFGEGAARRERNAQVQQATFAKLRIMDQVAQEVAEANIQVGIRKQQVDMAQTAISRARDSYQRNIDRIRDGQGLPIEVLQAIQALEASERAYLRAVADYNRAQLQLQWALGWPVNAIPEQTATVAVPSSQDDHSFSKLRNFGSTVDSLTLSIATSIARWQPSRVGSPDHQFDPEGKKQATNQA